ncbi:MAG: hypothetical protein HYZ65_03075 [Burkholderiales bacterium]|nr:hypothetical protein [Burkholderiales bacterium]
MNEQFDEAYQNKKHLVWGVMLIAAGCVFLLDRINLLDALDWWYLFPAMIALHGLIDIVSSRQAEHIAKGCFNLVLAFWLYASLEQLWGWTFRSSWPLLLIAFGLKNIVAGLLAARK